MEQPTKADIDACLTSIERTRIDLAAHQPDCRRLPPLRSMEFSDDEKQRLKVYCAQMTRYRLRRWWQRLLRL